MPRYVAAMGGRFPENFDQRYVTDEGRRVFPDQLSEGNRLTLFEQRVVVAQALIVGDVRQYCVGPPDQPKGNPAELTKPRRREVLGAINETTGRMRFVWYAACATPLPSLVVSLRELLAHPEIAGDAERQLKATALHDRTTRAYWGPSPEQIQEAQRPLLTFQGQLLLGLSDTLPIADLWQIMPWSPEIRDQLLIASNPDIRRLLAETPAHAVRRLALGGSSRKSAGEYQTALDVADPLNNLAAAVFSSDDE